MDSSAAPLPSPANTVSDAESPQRHEFGARVARWEQAAEWPLTCLALLFLAGYAIPVLLPDLPADAHRAADWLTLAIWALFGVDYAVRVCLAQRRVRYVRRHLLELSVLVLPALRPLRMLRVALVLITLYQHARVGFRGTIATYVAGAVALMSFLSSVAILDAERGKPGSNIDTFGDALWWSFATMTTVGYGDYYPTTSEGRLIALVLMLVGIGLLGVVTASLAAWFIEWMQRLEDAEEHTTDAVLALRAEIRALRAELAELRTENTADIRTLSGKS